LDDGAFYDLEGQFYLNPGKEWTSTYLLVETAIKSSGGSETPMRKPTFEILATIWEVHDTHLVIFWRPWDDYENASYGQTARPKLEKPLAQPGEVLNQKVYISGNMESANPKEWICHVVL
jgi:hypothetical protein